MARRASPLDLTMPAVTKASATGRPSESWVALTSPRGSSEVAAPRVEASRPASSPPPKSAEAAAMACSYAWRPWTRVVTSSARAFCATRVCGAALNSAAIASISSNDRSENTLRYFTTSRSSALSQNWLKAYGLVRVESSHTVPDSVLPNFVPSAFVISGVASACTDSCSTRRMRSTPEVRLPHWSEPPASTSSDAGGEVAPLVGAAGLQGAAIATVELEVVIALHDLVRELREGDP